MGAISPAARKTAAKAAAAVEVVWNAWLPGNTFPGPQSPLPLIGVAQLTSALIEDNRNVIPYLTARRLVAAFIDVAGPSLSYSGHLDHASQRLKAIASELIGSTASIAVAKSQNLGYIGSRSDVNNSFGSEVWRRPWGGDGPDYLFANHVGDITFLESKGRGTPSVTPTSPLSKTFLKHKVQSLNARLVMPSYIGVQPVVRYILSRVTKEDGRRIQIQWFNDRHVSDRPVVEPLVLAVALSNFKQIARAQGVDPFEASHEGASAFTILVPRSGNGLIAAQSGSESGQLPGTVFIRARVKQLFVNIEKFFETRKSLKGVFELEGADSYAGLAVDLFHKLAAENLLAYDRKFAAELEVELQQSVMPLPMGYAVAV